MSAQSRRENYKKRYHSDPQFRAHVLRRRRRRYRERYKGSDKPRDDPAKRKASRAAKLRRCPESKRLWYLETTVGRVREQIERYQELIGEKERLLLRLIRERQKLREFCRGK
jgi:hypothetical protein